MFRVVMARDSDRDLGRKKILRDLDRVDNAHADIGLFEDAPPRDDSELTQAQIGAVHEFGAQVRHGETTTVIPERSWLRSNHDKNVAKYNRQLDEQYSKVLAGRANVISALTAFAEKVASDVRRNITELRSPPNAPSTVERKGSSNPLIDTGSMRNAVSGRVIVHGRKV